jgi:hypothetical protein
MSDFSYLKKGDVVVLEYHSSSIGYRNQPYEFATVTDVGVKKIKTDKGDFSVHGHKWGSTHYSPGWQLDDISVEKAGQENIKINTENHRRNLAYKLSEIKWRDYPLETLEAVTALLKQEVK